MKCFFKGLLGASLLLLIFFFTVPLYANYQARAETAGWLLLVEEVKNVITENAVKNKSLQQGQVTWQCVGGSQHAMPSWCQ